MVKADYEIQVKKVRENGEINVEATMPEALEHGKTVHYSTTGHPGKRGGLVTITFKKKSPYLNSSGKGKHVVTSTEPPIVLIDKPGKYFGECSIETKRKDKKNGRTVTVRVQSHGEYGGNHNVT